MILKLDLQTSDKDSDRTLDKRTIAKSAGVDTKGIGGYKDNTLAFDMARKF